MKLTPLSAVVDDVWGKKGTPKRDAMEALLKKDLHAYYTKEAIMSERLRKKHHLRRFECYNIRSGRTKFAPYIFHFWIVSLGKPVNPFFPVHK